VYAHVDSWLLQGALSAHTMRLLKQHVSGAVFNALIPQEQFWDADTTKDELKSSNYFNSNHNSTTNNTTSCASKYIDDSDTAGTTLSCIAMRMKLLLGWPQVIVEHINNDLLVSALGGCISYLRSVILFSSYM
jgi:hypothetical protein